MDFVARPETPPKLREGETKLERFETVPKELRWQLRGQEAVDAEQAEREAAEA
jgi:hypothetical protein